MKHLLRTILVALLFLPLLFCFSSCSPEGDVEQGIDMTVLVYMAADNNLSSGNFHQQDIDEMVRAAGDVPADCRLLVYVDDRSYPRILSIEKDEALVVHRYDVRHDSGKPETLDNAMGWVVDNYPSDRYGLVLWSHGDSWIPAKAPAQRVICVDSSTGSWMEIDEVADVLSHFPKLEYIMFDACFMQSVEVAYELRHVARYLIASPAEIPSPGAPYDCLVGAMFVSPVSPHLVAKEYCAYYENNRVEVSAFFPNMYYGALLSVVDCSRMEALAQVTAMMLEKYVSPASTNDLTGLLRYYPISSNLNRPEYFDMNGYMRRVITDDEDYREWKRVLDSAVPRRCGTDWWFSAYKGILDVDKSIYSGISCYVPQNTIYRTKLNEQFQTTSWYVAAGWQAVGW